MISLLLVMQLLLVSRKLGGAPQRAAKQPTNSSLFLEILHPEDLSPPPYSIVENNGRDDMWLSPCGPESLCYFSVDLPVAVLLLL